MTPPNSNIPTPRTDAEFIPIERKYRTAFEQGFNEGISLRCSQIANPYRKDLHYQFCNTEHDAWNVGFNFGKQKKDFARQLERELTERNKEIAIACDEEIVARDGEIKRLEKELSLAQQRISELEKDKEMLDYLERLKCEIYFNKDNDLDPEPWSVKWEGYAIDGVTLRMAIHNAMKDL